MLSVRVTYRADASHSMISTYPLCFDTLAHSWVRQKSQPLSFQPLPHSLPQNTRGGHGSRASKPSPGLVVANHCSPRAAFRSLSPLESLLTKSTDAKSFIICTYEKWVGGGVPKKLSTPPTIEAPHPTPPKTFPVGARLAVPAPFPSKRVNRSPSTQFQSTPVLS